MSAIHHTAKHGTNSYRAEAVTALLTELDSYILIRGQLNRSEDGSDDERRCLTNAALQWHRVISARDALIATNNAGK